MFRRIMLSLAAVLAIGACSDQQDPDHRQLESAELALGDATIGINVVLKAPATVANRTELAKYGTLAFVKLASPDAERNAIPIDAVEATETWFDRSASGGDSREERHTAPGRLPQH